MTFNDVFRSRAHLHRLAAFQLSSVVALAPAYTAPAPIMRTRTVAPVMETAADLELLAGKLNPKVGFYDPMGLVKMAKARGTEMETIGWLRHAEIKHGRVAMAAFVGFMVQSNGIYWPWALTTSGITHADISAAGGPADQWDALPTASKVQILCFVGFLEFWGETTGQGYVGGEKHYVYGGKPGAFPSFAPLKEKIGHPVLDLFDPFGFSKNKTPEQKERGLLIEINNGRLAQIGIFGFVCKSKGLIVPGMDGIDGIVPYSGEYMAPFTASDSSLPFVSDMIEKFPFTFGNMVPGLY